MKYTLTYTRESTHDIEASSLEDAALIAKQQVKDLDGKLLSIYLKGYAEPTAAA